MLTTRPHGFANLSIGTGFQTATVLPFGRDDVGAFIRNWYRVAYGDDALGDEPDQLIGAIHANQRVEQLATNPLLCTVIAIVFRNNRVLPDRRVELYFKCCQALLETWESNKDIKASGMIANLSLGQKLDLLANLAQWLHSETERLAAPEDEIVRRIAETLKTVHEVEPGRAEEEAHRFISAIRDRAGLLRGRGDGSLEFSHRTFQGYLAARHIRAMKEEPMIDAVMPHLHEAWWDEVLLLLFGEMGSDEGGKHKVEQLALSILGASGRPLPFLTPPAHPVFQLFWAAGGWLPGWQLQQRVARLLGRDLILAIRGYNQCVATARSKDLTERLKQEVATLVKREIATLAARIRHGPVEVTAVGSVVGEVVRHARHGPLGTAVVATLLAALKDRDESGRRLAVRALGPAAPGDNEVVGGLLAALKVDDRLRDDAAWALGPAAASGNPSVVAALLAVLKDDSPFASFVRMAAVQALGMAAPGDNAVTAALLTALKDDEPGVQGAAAQALGPAASDDDAVLAALLGALKDNYYVQNSAAQALSQAASGDNAVVVALLTALKSDDPMLRSGAARALGPAAPGHDAVVAALLAALKDEDAYVPIRGGRNAVDRGVC